MQNYRERIYLYLLEADECSREDVAWAGILLLLCSASAGVFVALWAPSPVSLAAVFCCADLPKPVDVSEKGSSSSLQLCAALTECLSLISAMSSFCLWIQSSVWEEQCKRLREGLWLMPSSWPDSTATTETTGFVLMCAFIHSPCLTLWHR